MAHETALGDPRAERTHSRRWYGWQTLVADAATFTVVPFVGNALDKRGSGGAVLAAVVGSYLLAPPIVHLAHGRPGIAAASFGLRLGMPVGGAFLGLGAASGCGGGGGYCQLGGAAVGFVLGVIGASTIDAAAFSYENKEHDAASEDASAVPPRARPQAPRGVALTPVGGPRQEGGFDVGLGGTF